MSNAKYMIGFHDQGIASSSETSVREYWDTRFTYTFENFFHPFVGELIGQLNRGSLRDMMDTKWQWDQLRWFFFDFLYDPPKDKAFFVDVISHLKEIDVSDEGPYANYNWELFYHIPLTIAVHLSKNQRFAEAQRWFHYIFDPTCNDQSVKPRQRFWKFLAFREEDDSIQINEIVRLLSIPAEKLSPEEKKKQQDVLNGYNAILAKPFMPHAVARTRHLAYKYCVVMKYLDNLIAWGDHLFQQDTVESINEATRRYVLAANLLGPRPQRIRHAGRRIAP